MGAPSVAEGDIHLDGDIHPAFVGVARQFRRIFRRAGGGALAVRLRGEPVLDVWAGERSPGRAWERDTMSLSFSTTKGVTATVLHRLADRGELKLDATVASYWPAFGDGGKDLLTVGELLAHKAGLHDVRRLATSPADVLDHELMEQRLAAAAPTVAPGRRSGYHGFTFGWLCSGLARAVTGLDMRELYRREVVEPLGLDGCELGVDADDAVVDARVATLDTHGLSLVGVLGTSVGNMPAIRRVAEGLYVEGFDHMLTEYPFPVRRAQMPAVNGCFTARSLATIYAALANGGVVDGVQYLEPVTIRRATRPAHRGRDYVLGIDMRWRFGYHQAFAARGGSGAAFGHYGYGGSGAWADPRSGLSVGFVTNRLGSGTTPIADSRLLRLNASIMRAAERV